MEPKIQVKPYPLYTEGIDPVGLAETSLRSHSGAFWILAHRRG